MSAWKEKGLFRFVVRVLVLVMALQAWPLWQLSHAYRWVPERYLELFDRLGAFLAPQEVQAADAMPGDLDDDCDVDFIDLNIILAGRNTPASDPEDPRDLDGDGVITVLDARKCVLLCTRSRCAVEAYTVNVPDLIGMGQEAAVAELEAAELTLGTITREEGDPGPTGTVVDQSRPAGATVAPGCVIDLLVVLSEVDLCPDDPNKIEPGICGCGVPDTDTDSDGTPDCIDNCPDDQEKTEPGVCGCGTADTDTDGDGTPDCNDLCPEDLGKTEPGVCGCGSSDADSDSDGTPDCNDLCPGDPGKIDPGVCGCGLPDTDSDGDGISDCSDNCPNDPNKTSPGICGCGIPDTDTDSDGTSDCIDNCPDDQEKTEPGVCGCGIADTDTDGDGIPDCNDLCPEDLAKTEPGVCGCGSSDADSDSDGTPDCVDNCPEDHEKTEPGVCGCGVPETDSDGDGTPDCIDEGDPPVADAGENLEYIVAPGASRDVVLDGTGSTDPDGTIDSYTWTGSPDPDDIAQPTVNLPAGPHTFSLVVTDNDGNDSDPDTVTITITESAENLPPSITSMPLTVASVDYEYVYPVIASDPNGDTLTCALSTCPDGMAIDESAVVRWTPTTDQISDHQISLLVDDGNGGTDTQTYWVRVTTANSQAGNRAPIAHAGDDYTVEEGVQDILDGSYSFDAEGDHLRYTWVQTGGPEVELDNYHAQQPAFVAPQVDENTLVSFALTAYDGTVESGADEVSVMVLNMDLPSGGNGMVTNSNDSGPGSLQAAVNYANANPGTRITFSIPDTDPCYEVHTPGVWSLNYPSSSMSITGNGIFVDGNSQTEEWGDRNSFGPEIELYSTLVGVGGHDNVIRGLVVNQTPRCPDGTIYIREGSNITIIGNYIGTDATGTQVRSPSGGSGYYVCVRHGIWVSTDTRYYGQHVENLRIGGSRPGEGNLISGMGGYGIWLDGYYGDYWWEDGKSEIKSVTIQGNTIGLDRTGTVNLVDRQGELVASNGIGVEWNRPDLLIGGTTPGSRNVIAGWYANIKMSKTCGKVRIQGNYIGTDAAGSSAIPVAPSSPGVGIWFIADSSGPPEPAEQLLLGGSVPGAGNVISGHKANGVLVSDKYYTMGSVEILGNFIGTDSTGTIPVPNYTGIRTGDGGYLTVGGSAPGERNVISGNSHWGIYADVADWRAPVLDIIGNWIGLGADGVTPVPNGDGGIYLNGRTALPIGGTAPGEGNIIAHNAGPGIYFPYMRTYGDYYIRARARILGNEIYENDGLGLARDNGVLANDVDDGDLAARTYAQNFPVITQALASNGMTRIQGALDTVKPENCLIELFANTQPDPSQYGEGERWVAAFHPDPAGVFDVIVPEELSGQYVTATATRTFVISGDPPRTSSEFSAAVLVGDEPSTNSPPVIDSTPVSTATAETLYAYQVDASDPEGGPLSYALALAPEGMGIDADGLISWTPEAYQEGHQVVTVVVRDAEGLYASQNYQVQVLPFVDTEPPVVSVNLPYGFTVEEEHELIGTICDPYLVWYGIEIGPEGSGSYRLLAEGDACVEGGTVGVIDPTLLPNGLYDIRITAYDEAGHLTVFEGDEPVEVSSKLKVGQFALAFQDISIPVSGIPITVTRTYNSFDKAKGDFGVGWDMALVSGIKVQVTRTLGDDWWAEESGSWLGTPTYSLETDNVPKVLVTYADGSQDRFEFTPDFVTQPALDPRYVRVAFTPLEGTTSSLEVIAETDLLLYPPPAFPSGDHLVDSSLLTYDPDRFRLTTAEGIEYVISRSLGLESIADPNGNTLTFGPGGITHSAGLSINMDRDSEDRITRITDPMGYEVAYDYDGNGDLIEFTDQDGHVTQYGYDEEHNLVSIIDPRGIEVLETEYDELGRMIGTTDALGNITTFAHDTENAVEYITDRLGYTTAYEYDNDGNVISITDPLGNVTSFAYDERGNELSKTDALGNTTSWTYDDRDNKLTETDPLGNMTTWTYNGLNKILTKTDPLGNVTTYTYDGSGNRLGKTDALGNTITYAYDGGGNVTSMTDCDGNVTSYTYDSYGNKLTETDALGNVTTYAYDSNGNMLSVTDALGNTTTRAYDNLGNLIMTTDPLGNVSITEYNEIGKKSAEVDKNGNRTEYGYDENGKLVQTTHPDGTVEAKAYDANGNRMSSTDRAGRITQYEYDPSGYGDPEQGTQGRLAGIVYADGSTNRYEYDDAGRMSATVDENGNRTQYEYDAAGRRIRITDALGNVTTFSYDANGNRISMTDGNGNVTSYVVDALNRRVQTVFDDGTSIMQEYAASCCSSCTDKKTAETDQAGNTTLFDYDALGRLTRVTDAMGGETTYAYDAVGNKLSQTDANGNATGFTYDAMGRILTRTLPMGQSESFTYDAVGNLVEKTNFNGDTVAVTFDSVNRLTRKQYPDTSEISFAYTPTGKRASATDVRGVTAYSYDLRDRLLEVENPDGTGIAYTYDARGNRTSVTVPSGTTSYAYDALNRLDTVD